MKPHELFSLRDKVVVVIGGKGVFGKAMVKGLAETGAVVYTAARNLDELEEMVAPWQREGLKVFAAYCDQADEESLLALRDMLLERHGRIDGAVLNAVARPVSGWNCPKEEYVQSMDINATGTFLALRTFGDAMQKTGKGAVVLIGSMQGMVGVDGSLYEGLGMNGYRCPDYYFHKGGAINLARAAASYYGPAGVRVNIISPGGCRSERNTPEFAERYAKRTFLGRMAQPEDITGTVAFLMMDASAYITGANIPVDGGYTAK